MKINFGMQIGAILEKVPAVKEAVEKSGIDLKDLGINCSFEGSSTEYLTFMKAHLDIIPVAIDTMAETYSRVLQYEDAFMVLEDERAELKESYAKAKAEHIANIKRQSTLEDAVAKDELRPVCAREAARKKFQACEKSREAQTGDEPKVIKIDLSDKENPLGAIMGLVGSLLNSR